MHLLLLIVFNSEHFSKLKANASACVRASLRGLIASLPVISRSNVFNFTRRDSALHRTRPVQKICRFQTWRAHLRRDSFSPEKKHGGGALRKNLTPTNSSPVSSVCCRAAPRFQDRGARAVACAEHVQVGHSATAGWLQLSSESKCVLLYQHGTIIK